MGGGDHATLLSPSHHVYFSRAPNEQKKHRDYQQRESRSKRQAKQQQRRDERLVMRMLRLAARLADVDMRALCMRAMPVQGQNPQAD